MRALMLSFAALACLAGAVSNPAAGEFNLLFFVNADCPISNYYAPEIRRICASDARLHCTLVYTDPGLTVDEIRKHKQAYGHGEYPFYFDTKHELVKQFGVKVTPEVALVDHSGQAVYQGRIDNAYENLGKRRVVITQHELADAITEALAGRPVGRPRTQATGCSITPVELLRRAAN